MTVVLRQIEEEAAQLAVDCLYSEKQHFIFASSRRFWGADTQDRVSCTSWRGRVDCPYGFLR